MTKSVVSICLLYPDLLGTYGDGGNATVLSKRLTWRGIDNEIVPVAMGASVPKTCDLYVMGGGEDQPQSTVTSELSDSKALHRAVENGAAVLAVCAGMQVLGTEFAVAGGEARPGLGLLDIATVRGEGTRRVGEVVSRPDPAFGVELLTGYENHGGITRLGPDAVRLGRVITGAGNDDGQGSEGAVSGKVLGTYLHGPVLARNPQLADLLLSWAVGSAVAPLDDAAIDDLRQERIRSSAAAQRSVRTQVRKLLTRS